MIKTTENGVIKINDLSFIEFSNSFRGFFVVSKKTGQRVHRFLLFWRGLTVSEVKRIYSLEPRKYDS